MTLAKVSSADVHLPGSALDASRMPGHWLLARLGKTVLRPGGAEMTSKLLDAAAISASDEVIEVAPGLGVTTRRILAADPARYIGVDRDPDASAMVGDLLDGPTRTMLTASAQDTGLPTASADVVLGEAYLTMQPDSLKQKILTELTRVLRPGGRFALHEIAFAPDDVDDEVRTKVRTDLTSTIKVSVHPLTVADWDDLLAKHGLLVVSRFRLPLHLLEPRRLLDDEGIVGATRFVGNVLRDHDARSRVRSMRNAMRANARHLCAYGMVAMRAESDDV